MCKAGGPRRCCHVFNETHVLLYLLYRTVKFGKPCLVAIWLKREKRRNSCSGFAVEDLAKLPRLKQALGTKSITASNDVLNFALWGDASESLNQVSANSWTRNFTQWLGLNSDWMLFFERAWQCLDGQCTVTIWPVCFWITQLADSTAGVKMIRNG